MSRGEDAGGGAPSVVDLFRILADEERIRLLAAVINRPRSTDDLAQEVRLPVKRVAQQVARLRHLGLLETVDGAHHFRRGTLQQALKSTAESTTESRVDLDTDLPDDEQRILANYLTGGRLRAIPAQQKKRDVVLRYLAEHVEADRMYSEREINEILKAFNDDYASLRRYLIDSGLMQRQVVRVVDRQALIDGTPDIDLRVTYWKPSVSEQRREG